MGWELLAFLDEGNGSVVADSSGNGLDLAITNEGTDGSWNVNGYGISAATNTSTIKLLAALNAAFVSALSNATAFAIVFKYTGGITGDNAVSYLVDLSDGVSAQPLSLRIDGFGQLLFSIGAEDAAVAYGGEICVIRVDTAQANAADRVRIDAYDGGSQVSRDMSGNAVSQNADLGDLTGLSLAIGNPVADVALNPTIGALAFFGIWSGAMSNTETSNLISALLPNDDADPLPPPVLSFAAAPSIQNTTATGFEVTLTSTLAAAISIVVTESAAVPSNATFDASGFTGNATAYSAYTQAITGLNPGTTYYAHVRATNGGSSIFGVDNDDTLVITNKILLVNNGQPIRYGQAVIPLLWDQVPDPLPAIDIAGMDQVNHVQFDATTSHFGTLVWPNVRYGSTPNLTAGSEVVPVPGMLPPEGYDYVDLSGYNPAAPGTIQGDAAVLKDYDQVPWHTEDGQIQILPTGVVKFSGSSDGTVTASLVDGDDSVHSSTFGTLYFTLSGDIVPDQFGDNWDNIPGAEPGIETIYSETLQGVAPDTDVTIIATGAAQLSVDQLTKVSSITRRLGDPWYIHLVSGGLGAVVTGGASCEGVAASFNITTRDANAPSVTSQPSGPASVTVNSQATFQAALSNMSSIQWRVDGENVAGATSIPFVYTPTAVGTYEIDFVALSPEGGQVQSNAVTLNVIAVANQIRIPELRSRVSGLLRGGEQNVPYFVMSDDRETVLISGSTLNLQANGVTPLVNNLLGNVGDYVWVGFPESDGTAVQVRLQVEA